MVGNYSACIVQFIVVALTTINLFSRIQDFVSKKDQVNERLGEIVTGRQTTRWDAINRVSEFLDLAFPIFDVRTYAKSASLSVILFLLISVILVPMGYLDNGWSANLSNQQPSILFFDVVSFLFFVSIIPGILALVETRLSISILAYVPRSLDILVLIIDLVAKHFLFVFAISIYLEQPFENVYGLQLFSQSADNDLRILLIPYLATFFMSVWLWLNIILDFQPSHKDTPDDTSDVFDSATSALTRFLDFLGGRQAPISAIGYFFVVLGRHLVLVLMSDPLTQAHADRSTIVSSVQSPDYELPR